MSEIEPVPEDDPRLKDDPIYVKMSAAEKLEHRRMLAQMGEIVARLQQRPRSPTWQDLVLGVLRQQLAVLERIEARLTEPYPGATPPSQAPEEIDGTHREKPP